MEVFMDTTVISELWSRNRWNSMAKQAIT